MCQLKQKDNQISERKSGKVREKLH